MITDKAAVADTIRHCLGSGFAPERIAEELEARGQLASELVWRGQWLGSDTMVTGTLSNSLPSTGRRAVYLRGPEGGAYPVWADTLRLVEESSGAEVIPR